MTLDEVAEINRFMDLSESIRRGRPPGYYLALRVDEIRNLRRVIMRKSDQSSSDGSFFTQESETGKWLRDLEGAYDGNQIKKIRSKINSIRGAVLVQEKDITDDGWAGRSRGPLRTTPGPSHTSARHSKANFKLFLFFRLAALHTAPYLLRSTIKSYDLGPQVNHTTFILF